MELPYPPSLSSGSLHRESLHTSFEEFLFFSFAGIKIHTEEGGGYSVRYNANSNGFRGPAIDLNKNNKKRILFVGDSMVEGQGLVLMRHFPFC